MENSFENLIERFGVPRMIVPNAPRLLYLGTGSFVVSENSGKEIDPQHKIYHRRRKHGESEFLLIKSRIEAYKRDEEKLLEHLKKQNLKPVEFLYRYKGTRTWDYSTEHWEDDKVSIATEADVEALSREDLSKAIEEKRVLWIVGWSSMGDRYVDFHICSKDFLPKDQGYHLLFEKPLESEMLGGISGDYEWEEEFFNYNSSYFTRGFFSDK